MSRKAKLEKALAFDVDAPVVFANKQYWRTSDHRKYVREGAAFESARLATLHEALVAAVEALEQIETTYDDFQIHGELSREALSKIDKVLEEK